MSSWSKKSRRELFQQTFALGIFWGWVSCYAATPLIVAFSPGHSDITRFRPWWPIAPDRKSFGSRRKNSKSCSDDWHSWSFWSAFRHFGTHFAETFCMSKSSWMMDPTRSREMSNCSYVGKHTCTHALTHTCLHEFVAINILLYHSAGCHR